MNALNPICNAMICNGWLSAFQWYSGALGDVFIPGAARFTLRHAICSGTTVSRPYTLLPTAPTLSVWKNTSIFIYPPAASAERERDSSKTFKQPFSIEIEKNALRIIALAWHMPRTGTQTGTNRPPLILTAWIQTTLRCGSLELVLVQSPFIATLFLTKTEYLN